MANRINPSSASTAINIESQIFFLSLLVYTSRPCSTANIAVKVTNLTAHTALMKSIDQGWVTDNSEENLAHYRQDVHDLTSAINRGQRLSAFAAMLTSQSKSWPKKLASRPEKSWRWRQACKICDPCLPCVLLSTWALSIPTCGSKATTDRPVTELNSGGTFDVSKI